MKYLFFLLVFSFKSYAVISFTISGITTTCLDLNECTLLYPDELTAGDLLYRKRIPPNVFLTPNFAGIPSARLRYTRVSSGSSAFLFATININTGDGCNTSDECFLYAESQCSITNQILDSFQFFEPNSFDFSCQSPPLPPEEQCEQSVIASCESNPLGLILGSFNYVPDGSGGGQCQGTCSDGSNAFDQSNIDDGSIDVGNTGSGNIDTGNTSSGGTTSSGSLGSGDLIQDEPIVSDLDPTAPLSNSVQIDTLINEVRDSKNDNNLNTLVAGEGIIDAINSTSSNISNDINSSSQSIIDAINSQTSSDFDDSGIINAIDNIPVNSGEDFNRSSFEPDFTNIVNLYDDDFLSIDQRIEQAQQELDLNIDSLLIQFKSSFTLNSVNTSYQSNILDLGRLGSHDISLSRFSQYFGGVSSIIIAIASLIAVVIILGGVRNG